MVNTPPFLAVTPINPNRVETQQQLFQSETCIQRFIEIGPRTILSTMAKRSANVHSNSHLSGRWSNPEFLSYHGNRSEVLYQYTPTQISEPRPQCPTSRIIENSTTPSAPKHPPSSSNGPEISAVPTADLSLQASHVILSIIAQKLGRRFDQVRVESTIRDLSNGTFYSFLMRLFLI